MHTYTYPVSISIDQSIDKYKRIAHYFVQILGWAFYQYCSYLCMYYIPTSNHPHRYGWGKRNKLSPQASGKYKIRILFPSSSISHRSLSAERHILNILPGRGTWQPILEWRTNATIYTPLLIKAHIFCGWNKCRPQRSERDFAAPSLNYVARCPGRATWLQTTAPAVVSGVAPAGSWKPTMTFWEFCGQLLSQPLLKIKFINKFYSKQK